ncbi:MAG: endonuclease/exonuclease/phosphatase family protein [Phycisphaeraceae bacterium]|nr:endonuclease/exonuclease/phosphatase family protein [Phycisphaeraceae bacterium]
MPSFGKPSPPLNYSLAFEKRAISRWLSSRNVPEKEEGKLLLASWNVANLGEQKRDSKDLKLIAHLMSRFELIAVQEVKDNLDHFSKVVEFMDGDYDWIVNDTGGNNERLGYVYDTRKVSLGKLFAEIAIPERQFIKHDVVGSYEKGGQTRVEVYFQHEFTPFDRNPFVGTFSAGKISFTLVNVHLYFGGFKNAAKIEERAKYARRVLEILMLSKWANKRRKGKNTYDRDIILLGDMNVPKMDSTEAAFRALQKSGLQPQDYFTKTGGSNLSGAKAYDQMAITEGTIKNRLGKYDVFDFDAAVFAGKWEDLVEAHGEKKALSKFNSYVKFHVSDHRPLWMQLDIA